MTSDVQQNLKAKIKTKDNVQNVKTSQRYNARWNSNCFKFRLNDAVSDSSWSDGGRLFHAASAAWENTLCPNFSCVRGCS